jgi:hypothetical protein
MTKMIEHAYAGLDSVRGNALNALLAIREAKTRQTQRELDREKMAKNKDAINALNAKLDANHRFVAVLKREAIHAQTELPTPETDIAIVHGYVWAADGTEIRFAQNISVTLAEMPESGTGKKLAQGKTDKRGYFKLRVPLRVAAGKVIEGNSPESARVKAVLAISSSKGRKTSLPSATVLLAANAVVFREFALKEGMRGKTSSKRAQR